MPDESRIVLLWRRVSDLDRHRKVADALGLPLVGEDAYSAIYDARGVLLGFWELDEEALRADDACSELSFLRWEWVVNPAAELVLGHRQVKRVLARLGEALELRLKESRSKAGTLGRFYDEDGNLTTVLNPAASASGHVAAKLDRLASEWNGAGAHSLSFRLLVSDVDASRSFYREVLGLRAIQTARSEAAFDGGGIVLELRPEPVAGLVRSLRRTKRLQGNWLILHVQDIERTVKELEGRDVVFEEGIERSGIGDTAHFTDPDGHSLALWQPSGETTDLQPIDFYPQLERILAAKA
jgi:predicted enzyme related to lactoylglutathione lyase